MVEGKALNRVSVAFEADRRAVGILQIPQLDNMIARSSGKNVGCGWVECDLSDFTG